MDEEILVSILRSQAWERAKGEINSILVTFYGRDGNFLEMDAAAKLFIQTVEDNGYAD